MFWKVKKNKESPVEFHHNDKRCRIGIVKSHHPALSQLPPINRLIPSDSSRIGLLRNSTPVNLKSNINNTQPLPQRINDTTIPKDGVLDNNNPLRRPISELPQRFRSIFEPYICFNGVQSMVFDTIFQTDDPIVVSAPTGSGKTGVFELAIIKMIQNIEQRLVDTGPAKVVYLAPTKALVTERRLDWDKKFKPFNIECVELTSDSYSPINYKSSNLSRILLATPEKWDSVTRSWSSQKAFIQSIRLLLVDEVHLVNDGHRGATLEAVISRMKIIRSVIWPSDENSLRFIAVSATVTNIHDIADWFSTAKTRSQIFQVDPQDRPVKLRTVVLGYSCKNVHNDFQFDYQLNHKLVEVLNDYSNKKPSIIFCATRKSAMTAAQTICKGSFDFSFSNEKRNDYLIISRQVKEKILQETTRFGVAYHHAGLTLADRRLIEESFLTGKLMVLCCTSTLAMGVNLPAHLVVIKNTFFYDEGRFRPYTESSIVQMMGRAGRPQFDTEATAVIMTKSTSRDEIERMLTGKLIVDSHLHKHLVQHLNSEIVLGTVTNESIARKWIDSTYLHVRLLKAPENYGLKLKSSKEDIESSIIKWCDQAIKMLLKYGMVKRDKHSQLESTDIGRAMAKHYISIETMIKLVSLIGDESQLTLLQLVTSTNEVIGDVQLRTEDRPSLFKLNNPVDVKHKLRYPVEKVDTREKKALVLIEATFGNLTMSEISLFHESLRVIKNASRVVSCLRDLCIVKDDIGYRLLSNALRLSQCFEARLWEDSIHISKQIEKIGPILSNNLSQNGLTSFELLRKANPRNIELFCNRLPPFGSNVQQTCFGLPKYEINITFNPVNNYLNRLHLMVEVKLVNGQDLRHNLTLSKHTTTLIVGAINSNKLFLKQRIQDNALLIRPDLSLCFGEEVSKCDLNLDDTIEGQIISDNYVGLDVVKQIKYIEP